MPPGRGGPRAALLLPQSPRVAVEAAPATQGLGVPAANRAPRARRAPTASRALPGGARGDRSRPQQRWDGHRSAWPSRAASPAPRPAGEAGAPSSARKRMEVQVGSGDPPDGAFDSGSPRAVAATGAAGTPGGAGMNPCNLIFLILLLLLLFFGDCALSRALSLKLTPVSTLQGPVAQVEWQGQAGARWRDTGTFVMGDPAPRLLSPRRRGEAGANVIKRDRQEEKAPLAPGPPHARWVLLSGPVEAAASFHIH